MLCIFVTSTELNKTSLNSHKLESYFLKKEKKMAVKKINFNRLKNKNYPFCCPDIYRKNKH